MSTWKTRHKLHRPAKEPMNWLPLLAVLIGIIVAGALVFMCAFAWGWWQ